MYYEAQMLSPTGRSKKVFCYILPKVLRSFLKHFVGLCSLVSLFSNFKLESTSLVLFPKDYTHVKCVHPLGYEITCDLYKYNYDPSFFQLIFEEEPGKFTLDDGYQQSLSFYSTQREVLAATYYRFLLKNIGE